MLNEHIDPEYRARWNIFGLVSMTGWSGSAFVGGALADRIGYRKTFCITLGFHAASLLCLLPLLWLVPRVACQRAKPPLASADAEAMRERAEGGVN